MTEHLFIEIMEEILRSGKVIKACDVSVKNGVIGVHSVIMTRDKEEIIRHEMHAKDYDFNESKRAKAVMLLDLITTLRKKIIRN